MKFTKSLGWAWKLTLGLLAAKMVGAPLPWLWVFAPVWLTLAFLSTLAALIFISLLAESP